MKHQQPVVFGFALWLVLSWLCATTSAAAEQARDPTLPPPTVAVGSAEAKSKALPPITSDSMSVVVRDGKPMLVVGTRLYQQGQQIGLFKIERISETEVWLRNGKEVHKIARFAGIERRAAAPERSTP
jgi:hypothetical protein